MQMITLELVNPYEFLIVTDYLFINIINNYLNKIICANKQMLFLGPSVSAYGWVNCILNDTRLA